MKLYLDKGTIKEDKNKDFYLDVNWFSFVKCYILTSLGASFFIFLIILIFGVLSNFLF
jgi:hypothetical protein